MLGPAGVHSSADDVRVGGGWAATLIVTGYPAEVGMAWLEPVLAWPGRLDVAIHIDPLPGPAAAARVRKQRARMESMRRLSAERGRLDDPLIEAGAADAADLGDLIARGESRLFEVGIYLTVHARTRPHLREAIAQVRATAASVLLDTHPATWRHLPGWCSSLPLGHDGLRMRRVMDTDALAASFPLASPDLPGPLPGESDPPGGVLYGVSPHSDSVLWWDRWAQDNANSVVLARSGAGKSYLVKVEVLRSLYDQVGVHVIDPEDEYVRLAHAVGGTVIQLGAPGVRVNPLDLPPGDTRPDALTRRALFLHTLVAVLIGEQPPPAERADLDRAITATYAAAGINHDPATWTRPAPLLQDLVAALTHQPSPRPAVPTTDTSTGSPPKNVQEHKNSGTGDGSASGSSNTLGSWAGETGARTEAAATLADRLAPWTHGSFKGLFEGPSTVHPSGHLIVWSTRHLPDELRAAGMLLALDAIWRDIDSSTPHDPATPQGAPRASHDVGGPLANPYRRPGHPATTGGRVSAGQARPVFTRGAAPEPPARARPWQSHPRWGRRLIVVDEAWILMREPEGARFLARMAKSARKRAAGLAVVTQDAADLLGSDLGQVVVANAATQILMRQAPQAIDRVSETFALSAGEARLLLSAERGQALLLAGGHRIAFQTIASPAEHRLAAGWNDLDEHDRYHPDPTPDPTGDWDEDGMGVMDGPGTDSWR